MTYSAVIHANRVGIEADCPECAAPGPIELLVGAELIEARCVSCGHVATAEVADVEPELAEFEARVDVALPTPVDVLRGAVRLIFGFLGGAIFGGPARV